MALTMKEKESVAIEFTKKLDLSTRKNMDESGCIRKTLLPFLLEIWRFLLCVRETDETGMTYDICNGTDTSRGKRDKDDLVQNRKAISCINRRGYRIPVVIPHSL